jgi:hypothetical protein
MMLITSCIYGQDISQLQHDAHVQKICLNYINTYKLLTKNNIHYSELDQFLSQIPDKNIKDKVVNGFRYIKTSHSSFIAQYPTIKLIAQKDKNIIDILIKHGLSIDVKNSLDGGNTLLLIFKYVDPEHALYIFHNLTLNNFHHYFDSEMIPEFSESDEQELIRKKYHALHTKNTAGQSVASLSDSHASESVDLDNPAWIFKLLSYLYQCASQSCPLLDSEDIDIDYSDANIYPLMKKHLLLHLAHIIMRINSILSPLLF